MLSSPSSGQQWITSAFGWRGFWRCPSYWLIGVADPRVRLPDAGAHGRQAVAEVDRERVGNE